MWSKNQEHSECPISAKQAGEILEKIDNQAKRGAHRDEDIKELKQALKDLQVIMREDIQEIKSSTKELRNDTAQLQLQLSKTSGFLSGAKIGLRTGMLSVVAAIISGIVGIYLLVTGQIDFKDLF